MSDNPNPPPEPIADGIYLDLPMQRYVNDTALSGSAFLTLLTEPESLGWAKDSNPLYIKPERAASRGRLRGSASHCAVLEGLEAYEASYKVKPEGVLSSDSDLRDFLRDAKARWLAQLTEANGGVKPKLKREDSAPFLQTGERDDLVARVLALDPSQKIWEPDGEGVLLPSDDVYVRVVERFVRNDPTFAGYVSGGFPEVSIFLTVEIDGAPVRLKCRVDYLSAHTVLDLKTYAQPPRRGMSLRRHCVRMARFNGADLQAVHNHQMVMEAGARFRNGDLSVIQSGPDLTPALVKQRLVIAKGIFDYHAKVEPVFRWLFLRMAGAPAGIVIPFRTENQEWHDVVAEIEAAKRQFILYREACGDGLWMTSAGEQEIGEYDWPMRDPEDQL
ncbi:MAG: hypothetical protein NW206_19775 [Hyphomonadaceae bacterium]|nr:hypothetical protein [Hyphomonadaceae bacterium]